MASYFMIPNFHWIVKKKSLGWHLCDSKYNVDIFDNILIVNIQKIYLCQSDNLLNLRYCLLSFYIKLYSNFRHTIRCWPIKNQLCDHESYMYTSSLVSILIDHCLWESYKQDGCRVHSKLSLNTIVWQLRKNIYCCELHYGNFYCHVIIMVSTWIY